MTLPGTTAAEAAQMFADAARGHSETDTPRLLAKSGRCLSGSREKPGVAGRVDGDLDDRAEDHRAVGD
jgi:hypothetical protein